MAEQDITALSDLPVGPLRERGILEVRVQYQEALAKAAALALHQGAVHCPIHERAVAD